MPNCKTLTCRNCEIYLAERTSHTVIANSEITTWLGARGPQGIVIHHRHAIGLFRASGIDLMLPEMGEVVEI